MFRIAVTASAALAAATASAEIANRHELTIELEGGRVDVDSTLGAWTEGGIGKLRRDAHGADLGARLAIEYRGQVASQLFAHAVVDYIEGAALPIGPTEAYLEWRPVPRGASRHRFRFGAFYPATSLENADFAWESPYSRSFSAVNAWLGEEIRPIGAEWRSSRRLGPPSSPQEFGAFAGLFYGNDPAGTLLFWRGFAVHDRQTRLNERLPLAPLILPGENGEPGQIIERKLDPIAEIDDAPGFFAGGEWSYARRARLNLSFYDNRADPFAFRDGQWGWDTRFWQIGTQITLPGDFGLVAQRMRGDTAWLIATTGSGRMTPGTELVTDEFAADFVLLSKTIGTRHRVSFRRDDFDLWRATGLVADRGHAKALAYSFALNSKLSMQLEWIEIESTRDLWPMFYAEPARTHTERTAEIGFEIVLFDSTG